MGVVGIDAGPLGLLRGVTPAGGVVAVAETSPGEAATVALAMAVGI
jgi:hypothetical protein